MYASLDSLPPYSAKALQGDTPDRPALAAVTRSERRDARLASPGSAINQGASHGRDAPMLYAVLCCLGRPGRPKVGGGSCFCCMDPLSPAPLDLCTCIYPSSMATAATAHAHAHGHHIAVLSAILLGVAVLQKQTMF